MSHQQLSGQAQRFTVNHAQISGCANHIMGNHNTITGDANHIIGNHNTILGSANHAVGNNNKARGSGNMLTGQHCSAEGACNHINGAVQGLAMAAGTSSSTSSSASPVQFQMFSSSPGRVSVVSFSQTGSTVQVPLPNVSSNTHQTAHHSRHDRSPSPHSSSRSPGMLPEFPPYRAPQPASSPEAACVICLDKARAVCIVDCGHAQFCYDCLAMHVQQVQGRSGSPLCPVCKAKITKVINVFT